MEFSIMEYERRNELVLSDSRKNRGQGSKIKMSKRVDE